MFEERGLEVTLAGQQSAVQRRCVCSGCLVEVVYRFALSDTRNSDSGGRGGRMMWTNRGSSELLRVGGSKYK